MANLDPFPLYAYLTEEAPCGRCAFQDTPVCRNCDYEAFRQGPDPVQAIREKLTRNRRGWKRWPGLRLPLPVKALLWGLAGYVLFGWILPLCGR